MKKTLFLLIMALAALGLAACGGDDEPIELNFTASDTFRFSPSAAEVPSGSEVRVTLENDGQLEHTWTLVPTDTDELTVSAEDAIGEADTGIVSRGEEMAVSFTAPEPGTYKFVCTVKGHAAAGMVGTLTVN